jgi:carbon monoxide dehydrogenase subunit G
MGTTRSTRSTQINAPVEKVFAFIADPKSMMDLANAELGDVQTSDDGSVTQYEWTTSFRLLPRDIHGVQTRLEQLENKRVVESTSTGPVITWEIESEGDGTRLIMSEEISSRLPLWNKVLEFIGTQGKGLVHKQDQMLGEIKEHIEAA